jgi:hypothetical protein
MVAVVWRHVYSGERDLACAVSKDDGESWSGPARIAEDRWKLEGCPHSGPAAVFEGPTLWVAWFTGAADRPSLRLASSIDGRTFSRHGEIHGGLFDANHPHAALIAGKPTFIFQAREEAWSKPRAFVLGTDGAAPSALPSLGGGVAFPRLCAGSAGRVYAVWSESDGKESRIVLCRGRLR